MDDVKHVFGVLVPVGPDGVGDGTLQVAAAEASRLETGVLLLHVVHSLVADAASTERIEAFDLALTKVGRAALTDAGARMQALVEDRVPVTTEIVFGHVARTLAERGSNGSTIILERRDPGMLERLATMSISTNVAAHARVPVIVVPPSWTAAPGHDLPVTVGIEAPADAKLEIGAGLERARATGRPLVALYAAWIAEPYQGLALVGYPRGELVANATETLASALEGVAEVGDDLTCDVRWERPVDALVAATRRSSELVLHRRPTSLLTGRLGPITRAVLHHAQCPVVVMSGAGTEVDS